MAHTEKGKTKLARLTKSLLVTATISRIMSNFLARTKTPSETRKSRLVQISSNATNKMAWTRWKTWSMTSSRMTLKNSWRPSEKTTSSWAALSGFRAKTPIARERLCANRSTKSCFKYSTSKSKSTSRLVTTRCAATRPATCSTNGLFLLRWKLLPFTKMRCKSSW